jgi:CheY-like chemotaxis protein
MNIILIDDDPTDLKLFSAVLRTGGHEVLARDSAEKAIEQIKAQQPELILLDLKLPGMDGLALARQLKQDPDTCHIPIVAVTAASEVFPREKAFDAGCDAYIVKPVDTRSLSAQVSAVLKARSAP